ncbi:alpha/beta hydrolase [bacterium]|nr:alpha/beta hydrolase [bacterium]
MANIAIIAAILAVLVFISILAVRIAARPPRLKLPRDIKRIRAIEYGNAGGVSLKLDIVEPRTPATKPRPVIVWIHGGAWNSGDKEGGCAMIAPFAQRGYFCASINYRLSQQAVFPAQIHDCKCAIRYLRAHAAEYNIDAGHIGVWGSSAGGHLAALLGTTADVKELEGDGGWPGESSAVQAVCDYCGPTDLLALDPNEHSTSVLAELLGAPPVKKKALAQLANPITHITRDAAPFLIVHGDKDTVVPMEQSVLLYDALKQAGVPAALHIERGAEHWLESPGITMLVNAFFDRYVGKC